MKVTKKDYEELILTRYQLDRLREILDFESIQREERYLKDAKEATDRKPYFYDASINTAEIYKIFGWSYPVKGMELHVEAKELIRKKFDKKQDDNEE